MDDLRAAPSFDAAAQILGHDTSTAVGSENARHDHRTYDLLDAIDDVVFEASTYSSAYRQSEVSA